MEQSKALVDSVSVTRATDEAIHYAAENVCNALAYMLDDKKKDRLVKAECRFCFYMRKSRIGGSAMTKRPCGICVVSQMYGSTNTDILCLACAVKHDLCKYCGADINLRPRRQFSHSPLDN